MVSTWSVQVGVRAWLACDMVLDRNEFGLVCICGLGFGLSWHRSHRILAPLHARWRIVDVNLGFLLKYIDGLLLENRKWMVTTS